jgi:hypothetical protein
MKIGFRRMALDSRAEFELANVQSPLLESLGQRLVSDCAVTRYHSG